MLKLLQTKTFCNRGFTLIEVLLSIALISLIVGIGTPLYQSFQNKNELDIATTTVVQSLRRAQTLSRTGEGDSAWGVRIALGSITVFRGTVYATRNQSFDENFQMSTQILPSGLTEVVFQKFTGTPQSSGTLTLTLNATDTVTVGINDYGTITY